MRWVRILLTAVLMASPLLAFGATPEEKCQDAFAVQGRNYFKSAYKAISKCEEKKTKSLLGPAVNCRPADGAVTDAKTELKLSKASDKVNSILGSKCGGVDIASLPLGSPCNSAASVGDLVSCIIDDAHGDLADELVETIFNEPNAAVPLSDKDAQKCQKTVSLEASKFARVRLSQSRSCSRKFLKGKVDRTCPDAKTEGKVETAREKMVEKLLAKCGDEQLDPNDGVVFGFPCDAYPITAFDREPNTNNNAIPLNERMTRCLVLAGATAGDMGADTAYPLPDAAPFSYGVAAGDATDSAFIAWTRTDGPTSVTLEVATDSEFTTIVHSEPLVPDAARDNVVKTDVTGLSAGTQYYYRFTQGGDTSRTGRIRTAPSSGGPITFAFSGDSKAEFKPFSVLDRITVVDPDLWLYIGDTIYSDSGSFIASVRSEYQDKYKENRDDRALRDLMAQVGTVTIWDDHEVTNDFAGTDPNVQAQMLEGSLAYRDYMPIREDPNDPLRLYRKFRWGDVAEFFLIDVRQYRSLQADKSEPACLDGGEPLLLPSDDPNCQAAIDDPNRTYLGAEQLGWLKDGLMSSTASFKFVMNGPPITTLLGFQPYDRWEGYTAERTDFLDFVTAQAIKNVIFLSTDFHLALVNDAVSPDVRELIGGAIAMNPFFRAFVSQAPTLLPLLAELPSLLPNVSFFELSAFNVTTATVTADEVTLQYRDPSGQLLKQLVIPAAP